MAKNKTKLEKERLEIIGNMPCYACYQDGKEVKRKYITLESIQEWV
jgi:hypothetical protein